MKYEKTPLRPRIKRKAIAKMTNDITKLSTAHILGRLYKRHEHLILVLALTSTWAWVIVTNL